MWIRSQRVYVFISLNIHNCWTWVVFCIYLRITPVLKQPARNSSTYLSSLTVLTMKSRSQADYVISHAIITKFTKWILRFYEKNISLCISCVRSNVSHMNTNTNESLPGVNVNSMALSDSASSSIPKKKRQHSTFMMVRSYIAKYIRNTLLSRKQSLKKRSTLTVVRDT